MYTRLVLMAFLSWLAAGDAIASSSGLRRDLDIATGVSAPLQHEVRSASSATAEPADEIFWDGYEFCGNGVIDPSEECDRTDLNGGTCTALNYMDGTLSCDKTCHFDTSQCGGACPVVCSSDLDCGSCGICFTNLCLH